MRHQLDVWRVLLAKEFKTRYKSSVLGYVWSVLNPLVFTAVMYFAFKLVMKSHVEHFALFLAAGLFPWQAFANATVGGSSVFLANANLIKKVVFPRWLLVAATLSSELVHLALSIPVLFLFMAIYGVPVKGLTLSWGLPLLFMSQAVICAGPALITATVNVFFRDMERLIAILVQVLFFLTPIIYPAERLGKYRMVAWFNPMACQVIAFRKLILHGVFDWRQFAGALASGFLLLLLGSIVYSRLIRRAPEVI